MLITLDSAEVNSLLAIILKQFKAMFEKDDSDDSYLKQCFVDLESALNTRMLMCETSESIRFNGENILATLLECDGCQQLCEEFWQPLFGYVVSKFVFLEGDRNYNHLKKYQNDEKFRAMYQTLNRESLILGRPPFLRELAESERSLSEENSTLTSEKSKFELERFKKWEETRRVLLGSYLKKQETLSPEETLTSKEEINIPPLMKQGERQQDAAEKNPVCQKIAKGDYNVSEYETLMTEAVRLDFPEGTSELAKKVLAHYKEKKQNDITRLKEALAVQIKSDREKWCKYTRMGNHQTASQYYRWIEGDYKTEELSKHKPGFDGRLVKPLVLLVGSDEVASRNELLSFLQEGEGRLFMGKNYNTYDLILALKNLENIPCLTLVEEQSGIKKKITFVSALETAMALMKSLARTKLNPGSQRMLAQRFLIESESLSLKERTEYMVQYWIDGHLNLFSEELQSCFLKDDELVSQLVDFSEDLRHDVRIFLAEKFVKYQRYEAAKKMLQYCDKKEEQLIQFALVTGRRLFALQYFKEILIDKPCIDVVQMCSKCKLTMKELIPLVQNTQISEDILGQLFLYAYQQKWDMQKMLQAVLPSALISNNETGYEARCLKLLDVIKDYICHCESLPMVDRAKTSYEMVRLILLNFSASQYNHQQAVNWAALGGAFEQSYQEDEKKSQKAKKKAFNKNKAMRELISIFGLIDETTVNHYEAINYLLKNGNELACSSYFARYADLLEQTQREEIMAQIQSTLSLSEQYRALMGYLLACPDSSASCFKVADNMLPQFGVRGVDANVLGCAILKHDSKAMCSVFESCNPADEHSLREQFLVLYCLVFAEEKTDKRRQLLVQYGFDSFEDSDFSELKDTLPLALFCEDKNAANHVANLFEKKGNLLAEIYWRLKSRNVVNMGQLLESFLGVNEVSTLWKKSFRRDCSVQKNLLGFGERLFSKWQQFGVSSERDEKLRTALFIFFGLLVEVYGEDITLRVSKKSQLTFRASLFDSIFSQDCSYKLREFEKVLVTNYQAVFPLAPSETAYNSSEVSLDDAEVLNSAEQYLNIGREVEVASVPPLSDTSSEVDGRFSVLSPLVVFGLFPEPSAPPLSDLGSVIDNVGDCQISFSVEEFENKQQVREDKGAVAYMLPGR